MPKLNDPCPLPYKSQIGNHIRGGEEVGEFDTLVDIICQQNSWCAFIMWWFSRLIKSFAFQEWKYVDKRHKWKRKVQKSAQIHFCGQTRAFRYDIVFRGIQPYLFSSQRIRALGLFLTKRGSEVSEETWGTFCLQFIFSLKKWAYLKYERVLFYCNDRLVGFSSLSPFFFCNKKKKIASIVLTFIFVVKDWIIVTSSENGTLSFAFLRLSSKKI